MLLEKEDGRHSAINAGIVVRVSVDLGQSTNDEGEDCEQAR